MTIGMRVSPIVVVYGFQRSTSRTMLWHAHRATLHRHLKGLAGKRKSSTGYTCRIVEDHPKERWDGVSNSTHANSRHTWMVAANDSENQTKQTNKSEDFSALLGCPIIAAGKQSGPERVQVDVLLLFRDQPLSKHALGVIGVRAS